MERDSMVFYRSFYEAIKELPAEEQVNAFHAIMEYALNGVESCSDPTARMALILVKPQIDKNNQRYRNGCRGGNQSRTEHEPSDNQTGTKQEPKGENSEPNVNDNDNVNVNENETYPLNPPKGEEQAENLTVETARGAEKSVDQSMTPAQGFAEFWKAYPHKVGKGAAEKAWNKIRPSKSLVAEILQAVERAKKSAQWQKEGGRYIPNPATWLNQKRWEDELEPQIIPSTSYDIDAFERSGVFEDWGMP